MTSSRSVSAMKAIRVLGEARMSGKYRNPRKRGPASAPLLHDARVEVLQPREKLIGALRRANPPNPGFKKSWALRTCR
jgi:hypothetical protein